MALRMSRYDHEFLDEAAPGTPDYVAGLSHLCSVNCRTEAHRREKAEWKESSSTPCSICGQKFCDSLGAGIIIYVPGLKLSKPFMYICFVCTRIPSKRAVFESGFSQHKVCLVCGKDMTAPACQTATTAPLGGNCKRCHASTDKSDWICPNCGRTSWGVIFFMLAISMLLIALSFGCAPGGLWRWFWMILGGLLALLPISEIIKSLTWSKKPKADTGPRT